MRREPDTQREAVHQPNIHIYLLLFGFPSHSGHHRALRRAPCAQQFLISYLFYVCASTQCQLSHVQPLCNPFATLFATPWTVACQALRSIGFPRQEHWYMLPFPPPGDLPDPGIKSCLLQLLHWQADSLPLSYPESSSILYIVSIMYMCQSQSPSSFHLPLSVSIHLFSTSVSLFLFCR